MSINSACYFQFKGDTNFLGGYLAFTGPINNLLYVLCKENYKREITYLDQSKLNNNIDEKFLYINFRNHVYCIYDTIFPHYVKADFKLALPMLKHFYKTNEKS